VTHKALTRAFFIPIRVFTSVYLHVISASMRSLLSAPSIRNSARGPFNARRFRDVKFLSIRSQLGDIFTPTEQHAQLRSSMRAFTESEIEPQAKEFNKLEQFNRPLFNKLGDLGILGLTVEEQYGGSNMDATAVTIVHEEMSASDPAFCLSYLAHSLLFVNNLHANGSHEQKAAFLPKTCSGELIGGMCMSEPNAGTDVLGMQTKALKQSNGQYLLSGRKLWITNGAVNDKETGDVFLVYAKTKEKEYSLFLVEKNAPGFSLGQRIKDKLGMRASNTAELVFDNVPVAQKNLVGNEGDAVLCMMRNLEIERVALAAMALGIARRSIEIMNAYAMQRTAFGAPINRYGQIQKHIADSYAEYAAGRAYVYNTARYLDLNSPGNRIDTDGVKLYASVMATTIANRAIQTLGGNGYTADYVVERLWRDAKLLEIGGGTLEAHQRNLTKDLSKIEKLP
jgi:isovaleryl-CoA dehydrogenase